LPDPLRYLPTGGHDKNSIQTAKRSFVRYVQEDGDVALAIRRIGRSPKTVWGYRHKDSVFAAAWDEAQQLHDDFQAHRLKGQTTKAVDVVIDGLHQTEDRRLAVAIAEKRIAKAGLEESSEPEPSRNSGVVIRRIIIAEQITVAPTEVIPTESVGDEP